MSTVFGTLSSDLKAALAAALDATADWEEGEPPDVLPPASTAVGYVWVTGSQRNDSDHLLQTIQAYVRYYPVQAEQSDPQTPIDPSPFYQAIDSIQAALKAIQRTADASSWFFEVTDTEVNHGDQYVTVAVTATGMNQFALT